jgi:hypothetical protein
MVAKIAVVALTVVRRVMWIRRPDPCRGRSLHLVPTQPRTKAATSKPCAIQVGARTEDEADCAAGRPVQWCNEPAGDCDRHGEPRDEALSLGGGSCEALPAAVQVFAEMAAAMLKQAHRGLRRATKDAVRLIDSTSVRLSRASSCGISVWIAQPCRLRRAPRCGRRRHWRRLARLP